MSLIVFVGLAWLLTAPVSALLLGRLIRTADQRDRHESLFRFLESDLRAGTRPTPTTGPSDLGASYS